MNKEELIDNYKLKKLEIEARLQEFKKVPEKEYFYELVFCLLTPQSQAKKCWQAVEELRDNKINDKFAIQSCLATKTRFHNNKAKYILEAKKNWEIIKEKITSIKNPLELRNWLTDNVLGLGLKESSHFLRNIGKSDNKIAILDRHILKNLKSLKIIKTVLNLNKKNYLKIEDKFKSFSKKINIPIDSLDLLFWSQETGKIFK